MLRWIALLFAFWSFNVKALTLTLPDQKPVTFKSTPEFKERKLSRLTLAWPADSVWSPVSFDAEMPEHKHGMNVKAATPVRLSDGSFQIDGVKLHMPGLWILKLKVRHAQTGEFKWIDQTLQLEQR